MTKFFYLKCTCALLLSVFMLIGSAAVGHSQSEYQLMNDSISAPRVMSLQECLDMAIEQSHRSKVSAFAVAAAEAQHQQALSGYWPQFSMNGAYELMDEPRNFIFPGNTFGIPATSFQTPGMTMVIPANAFGPGFPPQNVPLPVAPQTVDIPSQQFALPDQDTRLQDEQSWYASLQAKWLLWDGGMRHGIREQTNAGMDYARSEMRRTDLEIIDSVERIYYGAVMARQVLQVGEDTLLRMEATLNLTEAMYKEGTGTVKKTDFLDTTVMVETLRSAVALLEKNNAMAEAALAYTMGLAWNESVRPSDSSIPFEPLETNLEMLVNEAYTFSPDWQSLEAGILAAEGVLREAKSGHYPRVALTGNLHKWWNDYDAGYATDENKNGWTVALGFELPLFQGGLTRNKVNEARARLGKIQEERILLSEGIGLQVRDVFLGLGAAEKQYEATQNAMAAASENRDLNTRAYQNDLVETDDVIKSQLMEAFMSVQHYKMCYDHAALRSRLNLVVGTEMTRILNTSE